MFALDDILLLMAVGAVAGWFAGQITKGRGSGLIGNITIGVIGGFIGRQFFDAVKIAPGSGIIGDLATALIGAVALLFVIGLIFKR